MVYGVNPVFEVLLAGRRRISCAYLGETARNPRIRKLELFLAEKGVAVQRVDKGRLNDLVRTREHQGVALECSPYPYVPFESLLASPKLLLLDNVEDPHNVGAILRSAEVFGFDSVLLPVRGVPDIYPSVVKASAGATEHLKIAKERSANRYVQAAAEQGFQVVALDADGDTGLQKLASLRIEKLLLVIGGEEKSVGQFILNQAQYVVRIEQRGRINSLNASVAAGICMFALSNPPSEQPS